MAGRGIRGRFRSETFSAREAKPQKSLITTHVAEGEYDLVAQTLPTTYGISATVKLINRATFHQYIAITQVVRCAGPDGGVYRVGAHLLNPLSDAEVLRLIL